MIEWGQGESPGRLTLRTPAKVNLGLRLVGQRADGYHLIESVFVPIDLYDEIELAWHAGPDAIQFSLEFAADCELPLGLSDVTAGPDNLVVRAAEAFRETSGQAGTLEIRLRKRIPAGAGLGGGSSDAGAVLAGLARLAGTDSPDSDALAAMALQLGADVPYFLAPEPAFVSGIGEQIEPIDSLPSFALVIANPGISVATAEVYRVADLDCADSLTGPRGRLYDAGDFDGCEVAKTRTWRPCPWGPAGQRPRTRRDSTLPPDRAAYWVEFERGWSSVAVSHVRERVGRSFGDL